MLALAAMVPLATKQFDLSIGYHLGMAQVLIVGLQVTQGLDWPLAAALILLASLVVGLVNGASGDVFPDRFLHRHHGHRDIALRRDQLVHERRTNRRHEFAGQFHRPHPDRPPRPLAGASMSRSLRRSLWIVTERLPVGRNLYVIGANVRAAELTGINVRRHVIGAFVVAGSVEQLRGDRARQHSSDGNAERRARISSAGFRREPAWRDFDQARSSQCDRDLAFGPRPGFFVLRRAAARRAFLRPVLLQRGILIVAVGLSVYAAQRRQRAATAAKPGAS